MTQLLTYDDDKAMALADGAATVNRIVRSTPLERLREKRFGEWTAVQVIGHLADTADVFAERVRRAIEEDTPRLEAIAVGSGADPDADPRALARRILAAHQRITVLLQDRAARERPAVHSEWGRVTAGHIAAYQADHTAEHVAELAPAFPPGG
ncbi:MAG: DinB family protein [Chloroflexota bacterium]|nr:DinB family protein [Chloroflexota bacterium]